MDLVESNNPTFLHPDINFTLILIDVMIGRAFLIIGGFTNNIN